MRRGYLVTAGAVFVLGVGAWIGVVRGSAPAGLELGDSPSSAEGAPKAPSQQPAVASDRPNAVPERSPDAEPAPAPVKSPPKEVTHPFGADARATAGLRYAPLTRTELDDLKVPAKYPSALRVEWVHPRSPAAEASLRPGDLIVGANMSFITDTEGLETLVGDRSHTLITIWRNGRPGQVVLHKPFGQPEERGAP